jgi:hypothetical protein
MPFEKVFDSVYKYGIKEAVTRCECLCQRVDEQIFEESILERIYAQIAKADIVVADMTGRNPNVYYETGYAHALNKRVILLTQDSSDIPFDLKHYPHIVYKNDIPRLRRELEKHVLWCLSSDRSDLSRSISVPKVQRFSTLAEVYAFIVKEMAVSKRIDDISWSNGNVQEKSLNDKSGYRKYLAAKERALKDKNCIFREIFTFPNKARFERVRETLTKCYHGYNACYFSDTERGTIPRLSFILFDSKIAVIFFYVGDYRSSHREIRVAITDAHIVSLLQDYYDAIYNCGTVLKEADYINVDALTQLSKALSK